MSRQPPADELAETLCTLSRLQHRAAQLRAQIAQNPALGLSGRHVRADVVEQRTRVFDPALLPPDILNDPRYHREEHSRTVVCHALPRHPAASRPGWPIRRDCATALH